MEGEQYEFYYKKIVEKYYHIVMGVDGKSKIRVLHNVLVKENNI